MTVREGFFWLSGLSVLVMLVVHSVWPSLAWLWAVIVPLIGLGFYDIWQTKHTFLRIYPVLGHLRYLFESIRPEIQQYFVEDDVTGRPVSREFRSLVYQRAKGVRDTRGFGTQLDVNQVGYEWLNHSLNHKPITDIDPRVKVGDESCCQPFELSLLNISAMSYGALSKHAILALNRGAKLGGFAHNTGEGGLTPYHLDSGADLIWQIGTGYFSTRTLKGEFCWETFAEKSALPEVKMIEIKLSQGAKPGHGGLLPGNKVTAEIAKIRGVEPGKDVVSLPWHTAFQTPVELMQFIARLREISAKPVGFKLAIGKRTEFLGLCKAMLQTGILPDFITVDGGEGGTGAAPVEFANSVGMPLKDALYFVHASLIGCGLRNKIRLIASGKSFSAFHLFRLKALGADTVNSARGMMFALGCIQAKSCNTNRCPTGIATQDPRRYRALDIDNKAQRVANYHSSVIFHFTQLVSACGLSHHSEIEGKEIFQRISLNEVATYKTLYPLPEPGSYLQTQGLPETLRPLWEKATPYVWA